ncbi:MAG: 50S ribosomal protein L15 [Hyphomicrobiaceae bacterium]
MRLNEIKDRDGARKARLRIGRGIGSGIGKTGGRGGKGQTARSGVAIGGFEGGQMPLYRRLPKRGFTPINRLKFNEVTLARIQDAVDRGRLDTSRTVDIAALVAAGLVRRALDGVRVIGTGELKAKVDVKVNHATASAKAAIEQAGGSVELIVKKVLEADEKKRAKSAAKKTKTSKPKGGTAD